MSTGTAFHPRTSALNRKLAWGEWAGYLAAQVYADFHDIEYNAIREQAAVIDVSPLFKYEISGPDAPRLVDRVMTRDVSRLAVDRVFYTPWCDERGKVIDDGTVTRLAEDRFRWTSAEPSYRWFVLNAHRLDVEIRDVTEELAALALQGPRSRDVLAAATGRSFADLRYFRRRRAEVAGVEVDVTRTGYTGDLGYELWIPAAGALDVWDALFRAGEPFGIRPAGIRALDVCRVEAGLILAGVDYTGVRQAASPEQEHSPYEIGLGRLVDLAKADFVGKRALAAEAARGGPPRRLVGLELAWEGIEAAFARHGLPPAVSPVVDREPTPVLRGGDQVGRATSTTWSPILKRMIALAQVDRRCEDPGTRLEVEWTVEGEPARIPATVVPLPFLDLPRKRA
ncbi:MAG TPA: aminomethyltransferase family protein [Actinomycetota bacterium]|nr:aminomethyltransferase family protein [Actinomycetota bacterium]